MTAKEMFEEAGYELDQNEWNLKYIKEIEVNQFWTSPLIINFQLMGDNKFYKYDSEALAVPINMKELKAINKQIEELGWLDKKDKEKE